MPTVAVAHTAQLPPATLAAARQLMDEAFQGEFGDADWEHALGGLHAVVHDGYRVVAHGSVVQRRLLHRGRALRAGYVEAVAVAPDHQRQGLASAVMAQLEEVIRRAYDLGALSASDAGAALYLSRRWMRWEGPTAVLAPGGKVPTPEEDGSVYVFSAAADLDLVAELACDWREGDVW